MAKAKTKKPEPTQAGGFPTRRDSPFPDKFDLEAAIELVGELYLQDEPDQSDPHFELLTQIWDHEHALEKIKTEDRLRHHAEPIVPYQYASQRPGRLVKPTEMALHTLQAQKLFTGRKRTEDTKGIPGVMTFANMCFQLWMQTANDNPYADLLLIQVTDEIKEIDKEISIAIKKLKSILEERKERGLTHEIATSARPLVIGDISFGSPYGYKACDLLVNFDYYIRVASTLEDVGQIKTADSKAAKEEMWHRVRTFIYKTVRQADILRKEKLLPLSRADFAPDADDDAKIRVALVAQTLGELPQDILNGKRRPDFYKPSRAPVIKPASKGSAPA